MRNSGDLNQLYDIKPGCLSMIEKISTNLGISECSKFFNNDVSFIEKYYYKFFESICLDIRRVDNS